MDLRQFLPYGFRRSKVFMMIEFGYILLILTSLFPMNTGKTLTVQSHHQVSKRSPQLFAQGHGEDELHHDFISRDERPTIRSKRDVTNSSKSRDPIDPPAVTNLQDTHNQLVVYWAGKEVIVCLAKDSKPGSTSSSKIYISKDYGTSFDDVSDQLVLEPNDASKLIVLDKFYNHPKNNGYFLFTDVQNKYIFTTTNYGRNITSTKLEFVPDEVSFDPNADKTLIAYETSTQERRLLVSKEDFGLTWSLIEESIKSVAWDDSLFPTPLYLGRSEPTNDVTILLSTSLFLDPKDKNIVLTGVEEFEVKDDYIFATKRKANADLELFISYKRGEFLQALFPSSLPSKHFHIADVSNGQIFVCVTHNETVTNLYIGNEPVNLKEPPKFSLSLERIVFFKPNLTWSDSWLNDVIDEPFVELHRIDGLRGVYIASQFKTSVMSNKRFGLEHIQSLVTFDQGGEWGPLDTPDVDDDGEPIYCKFAGNWTKTNCSLHISQRVSELYPLIRAGPVLSQKSAIGLVMATGTVDSSLKGHLGVYLSTDGAAHWKQILQGNYLYNFGDHGGIIIAVKYYKQVELTNTLLYSTDEGNSWKSFKFYEKEIRVLGLMTEPGENTTVFFIFGSESRNNSSKSNHSWVLIKVDMMKAFERRCEPDDYKPWTPWSNQPGRHCLLGRSDHYERRIQNVNCYNGVTYERVVSTKPCLCKRIDFECDFGYVKMFSDPKKRCVKDVTDASPGVKAEWCKPGDMYYNRTKGYRKIPGDMCEDGESEMYLPKRIPCAVRNESEFMLVAKRDSVLRIDLNDFTRVEVLPLGNIRAAVAIDFDLKSNCIFWSDVNKDHIMRLHLDGLSEPELLVSQDLKSVEGLAFDWMSRNLYFVDGMNKQIEVIKTDVSMLGRMRKVILGSTVLDKPRGIAVHPAKGYLFWTDWSNTHPYIGRSDLDGSNALRIVNNTDEANTTKILNWPNGITVDYLKDIIYWVDAHNDKMFTADLNGNNVITFLADDRRVSHPFAVGVYNNFVYWDDWTTRSIYTTRTDVSATKEGIITIQDNLSRLMDLKVYGLHSQTEINQCMDSSKCKHLCFAKPDNTTSCLCPDGLAMRDGDCLCPDGKPVNNGFCASNCNDTNAFKCKSGFCILPKWRCDGEPDCGPGDSSDEENCDAQNSCPENQFRCVADGKCIPLHWRCDLDVDCEADGSDELDCPYPNTCNSADHFQCANQRCVLNKWRCDGEDDCGDNSDEKNCTTSVTDSCKINEFQCENKKCISSAWVCDGDSDCGDSSDETNCAGTKCPAWKFQCVTSGECIMTSWKCDGDTDCADGSDEQNCTKTDSSLLPPVPGTMFGNCTGMDQMFQCAGYQSLCIPIFWVNDGVKDCPLGDDELDEDDHATSQPTVTLRPPTDTCPDNHFRCNSGECVYEHKYCDGFTDCRDASDEPPTCHAVIERDCPKGYVRCGLSSICIPLVKLRDNVIDCPNGFDGNFKNTTSVEEVCNSGQFECDNGLCFPLFQLCDGSPNCLDGSDERPDVCKEHKTVYQVSGISVRQLEKESRAVAFVEWYVPRAFSEPMEFMPSYCEVTPNICQNATIWTKQTNYNIGNEVTLKKLKPFTNYSVTVYVRRNGEVYPPAIYIYFLTLESQSSAPYNVTVYQPDVYNLCIAWNQPHYPNGKITKYDVFFTPPVPPVSVVSLSEKLCISNKQSNPSFIPGTNYTFWVTATNGFNTSDPSKIVTYVYHEDVAQIIISTVKAISESLVTLEWMTTKKGVTEFEITYENVGGNYQFANKQKTKANTITIENLQPGTKFRYVLVPIHNGIAGAPFKGYFATKGRPLPKVQGLKLNISDKNVITASWSPVVDDRSKAWTYALFFGKSLREITDKRNQMTIKETVISLKDLEACENYLVDVGVVGPNGGIGPMSSAKQIMTFMDERAPPKNLKIEPGLDNSSIILSWNAACPVLENPIGYNVNIREINLNHTVGANDIGFSKDPKLKHTIKVPYGGRYEVTVTTNVKGARPSLPGTFDGLSIPPPRMLHQCSACNGPTIYWEPPELPTPILSKGNVTYVVWLSEDESFSKARSYPAMDTSLKLVDIENEHVYYVAVSVKDSEGLESKLSEHIPLQYLGDMSSQISMSTSNVLGIVITVLVVLTLLVVALGVFIVRHRKLQVSFLNFASSHYSSSSGAAIFQQSMEEEMDSPVIRGFSDDEPLLVA